MKTLLKWAGRIGFGLVVLVLVLLGLRYWLTIPQLALHPLLPEQKFDGPTYLVEEPGTPDRFWILEKKGRIQWFDKTAAKSGGKIVHLNVHSDSNENGLLGLVFHPEFTTNHYFYLTYNAPDPMRIILSRWTFDPASRTADPANEKILFEVEKPAADHNGGAMEFGPDGYLYFSFGESTRSANAQDLGSLLGKIHRIDAGQPDSERGYQVPHDNPYVGVEGARPEIWAIGFRNPWRFSFDEETGQLYVGDVGNIDYEEINRVEKGNNYGWPFAEGTVCNEMKDCDPATWELPVGAMPRMIIRVIIGGYVYRGDGIRNLQGNYIFGDFFRGLYSIDPAEANVDKIPTILLHEPVSPHPLFKDRRVLISSLAKDRNGELYVIDYNGAVYQIVGI